MLRLLPVIISALLFAAHILRFYGLLWAAVVLVPLITLLIRKPWTIRLWQILLALAIVVWLNVAIELVQARMALDAPWLRLAIILSTVISFNLFSLIWLENKTIRSFYHLR